jgi:signal recognition particle receptor subunit beta
MSGATPLAKVVVLGPAEAGKSTLIQALTRAPVNLAVRGRTVSMDHGMLERDGIALSIVGVPGQERFAPVRATLLEGARAAIWVHPAGQSPDPTTAAMVRELDGRGVPHLVFINEREGTSNGHAWGQGVELPSPREVLRGDALRSRQAASAVKEALWHLVFTELRSHTHGG